jgi:hypothetical protein
MVCSNYPTLLHNQWELLRVPLVEQELHSLPEHLSSRESLLKDEHFANIFRKVLTGKTSIMLNINYLSNSTYKYWLFFHKKLHQIRGNLYVKYRSKVSFLYKNADHSILFEYMYQSRSVSHMCVLRVSFLPLSLKEFRY